MRSSTSSPSSSSRRPTRSCSGESPTRGWRGTGRPLRRRRTTRRFTGKLNSLSKIVVSRTLDKAEWANTRLVKDDVAEEVTRLKQQPGKDIAILGSSALTVSLLQLRLVDELRIMVNPIVLGDGKSLFSTADGRIGLKLLKTRPFSSGNVLLYYQPAAR